MAAVLAFPLFAGSGPVVATSQPGFEITQKQGDTRIITLVSSAGIASTQYDAGGAPLRGSILRYRDSAAIAIDYSDNTIHATSLSTAVANKLAENSRVASTSTLPDIGSLGRSLTQPPADLSRLPESADIAGFRATAIRAVTNGTVARIWYSTRLPAAPASIGKTVAPLLTSCLRSDGEDGNDDRGDGAATKRSRAGASENDRGEDGVQSSTCDADSASLARTLTRVVALRTEVQVNGSWMAALDTSKIRRIRVAASAFDPPKAFKAGPVNPVVASASERSTPGFSPTIGRMSAGTMFPASIPATVRPGPGPLLVHPDVYQFFWGRDFSAWKPQPFPGGIFFRGFTGPHFDDILGGPGVGSNWYTHKLQQYGIVGGGVRNMYFIDDNPERDVGVGGLAGVASWALISAHVIQWSFQTSAPTFWWIFGGHDPLYMIFVPEELLNRAPDWSGYHAMAPNVANLLLPFFLWPFVHDFMPWGIAEISLNAIPVPDTSEFFRQGCKANSAGAGCSALTSFDVGTQNWTHELAEAITDPYPFLSWFDITKSPIEKESEIADICHSNSLPYASNTVVRNTSVATYWSNADNACVPESRPTLHMQSPTPGQAVRWMGPSGPQVVLSATATDPTDGDLTASISWTVDGAAAGIGGLLRPGPFALGTHSVEATVVDSNLLRVSAKANFTVFATPPTASILAPSSGTSVPAGSPLVLRGDATDAQDGAVPDTALLWWINGVFVGYGRTLPVSIPTPGPATILLTVQDSAHLMGSDMVSITVTPAMARPSVIIVQPNDGTVIKRADINDPTKLTFTAVARNADGTPILESEITWSDSVDGPMGTGSTVNFRLSGSFGPPTVHHVTVRATSASGAVVIDTITVTVVVLVP